MHEMMIDFHIGDANALQSAIQGNSRGIYNSPDTTVDLKKRREIVQAQGLNTSSARLTLYIAKSSGL